MARKNTYNVSVVKTMSKLRKIDISLFGNSTLRCMVPPHPDVLAEIKQKYEEAKQANPQIDVTEFLKSVGLQRGYNPPGKDDPSRPNADALRAGRVEIEKIAVPTFKPTGDIHSVVLLVDFDDNAATKNSKHYEEMLFSENSFATGSLRDYYKTVSGGRVNVLGKVSGWHRMPQKYSFYVGNDSGTDPNAYPHNAKKLVEDAVSVAKQADHSIDWDKYDINGDGIVDALFVVHAGSGAEAMPLEAGRKAIWSHKWSIDSPIQVTNKTRAALYLIVPEDGLLGVYAHEAGHLIFSWPDLYDACEGPNRTAGIGKWSLMAAGSWNNGGVTPAYPDGWCRFVQGWAKGNIIKNSQQISTSGIEGKNSDQVFVIPIKGKDREYFIMECRRKTGYDKFLPGEGLLVYHIDEVAESNCQENHLAVGVVQADGQRDLQRIGMLGNQGDDGDPFPGSSKRAVLNSQGFPNSLDYAGTNTGISLSEISMIGDQVKASLKIE